MPGGQACGPVCDGLGRVPQIVTPGPQTVTLLGRGVAADVWSYCGPGGGVDAGQMLWAPHPLLRAHVSMRNAAAVRLGQRR